jgi:hypothetical protein
VLERSVRYLLIILSKSSSLLEQQRHFDNFIRSAKRA